MTEHVVEYITLNLKGGPLDVAIVNGRLMLDITPNILNELEITDPDKLLEWARRKGEQTTRH